MFKTIAARDLRVGDTIRRYWGETPQTVKRIKGSTEYGRPVRVLSLTDGSTLTIPADAGIDRR